MAFKTPILFTIFFREDTALESFKAIKAVKPQQLFISGDGGRTPEEHVLCKKVRQLLLDEVDWECEVKTFFRKTNLGCREAMSSAITWFFSHVKEGIILEEDCVANESFFTFCSELLERYREDNRIMVINGTTFQKQARGTADYYFSAEAHCWGWATWRRAWKYYDKEFETYPKFIEHKIIKDILPDYCSQKTWSPMFKDVYEGTLKSWATIWAYSVWINHGLCIKPNVNLISNIGFGEGATHCPGISSPRANIPKGNLVLKNHPTFFVVDHEADKLEHGGIKLLRYMKRHPLFLFRKRFWEEYVLFPLFER